jgi:hypothetical protein
LVELFEAILDWRETRLLATLIDYRADRRSESNRFVKKRCKSCGLSFVLTISVAFDFRGFDRGE